MSEQAPESKETQSQGTQEQSLQEAPPQAAEQPPQDQGWDWTQMLLTYVILLLLYRAFSPAMAENSFY